MNTSLCYKVASKKKIYINKTTIRSIIVNKMAVAYVH